MDQPSPEPSPPKTSRVRKTPRASTPPDPAAQLDPLPDPAEQLESPSGLTDAQPAPIKRRISIRPPSGLNAQSLAMVALVGTFIVILTCICSWTMIAMAFFLNAPWG